MTVDAPHAGALLLELRETMRTIPELPDGLRPATFEEAYAIQDELQRQGGWGTGALKVGCTSEFAQQALGIDSPVVGVVADSAVFPAGAEVARSSFHHDPLLEGEFALRLSVDVEDVAQLDADPRSLADAVAPSVELISSRFDGVLGASGPSTVADNVANGGLVLGPPVEPPADLASLNVTLTAGGDEIAAGTGAAVLGDPYQAFVFALRHELARGRGVAAGTWVTTGTCTGISPCPVGIEVTASYDMLVTMAFTVVG
ncbi:MAG: hypothetical protein AAF480_10075 [Actinomycetota bacterium]